MADTSNPAASPAHHGQTPPPAAPSLTEADVRHIAGLAQLAPTDDQIAGYRSSLAAILSYVDRLKGLDLSGVEPLITPLPMTGPMGADEPAGMLPREALLAMAPKADGPFISVPKVLGSGDGGAA